MYIFLILTESALIPDLNKSSTREKHYSVGDKYEQTGDEALKHFKKVMMPLGTDAL